MLSQEAYIKNLDLAYLEKRLIDKQAWSSKDTKDAIRRYKNFLLLVLRYPNLVLAPASDIDEVWHNHILFTREYTRDCQIIFGDYLHHAPAQNTDLEEKHAMEKAQSLTSDLYIQEFNEAYFPDLDIAAFW
jgi:hypothetical protein